MHVRVVAVDSIQSNPINECMREPLCVCVCVCVYRCDFRTKSVCWGVKYACVMLRGCHYRYHYQMYTFHFSNKQGIILPKMMRRSWRRSFRVLKNWRFDPEFPKVVTRSWRRNFRVLKHCPCSFVTIGVFIVVWIDDSHVLIDLFTACLTILY